MFKTGADECKFQNNLTHGNKARKFVFRNKMNKFYIRLDWMI